MSLLDRLPSMLAGIEKVRAAIGVREAQTGFRRAWIERPPAPAPAAGNVLDRLRGLQPGATRIEVTADRGRILRTTRPLEPGEVVLVEENVVRAESDDEWPSATWALVRAVEGLDPDDARLVRDLHDAHRDSGERYAAMLRRGRDEGATLLGDLDPEEGAHLLGIARTNAFGRPDGGESYLFPASAMAAHSCAPSCDRYLIEGSLLIQTRRALAEGDEVTISYVDPAWEPDRRLVALLVRYGFVCDCPRCGPLLEQEETSVGVIRELAERLEAQRQEAFARFVEADT